MGLPISDWIWLLGIVLLVMLFMGPGLWSNHDELPITYAWRRWKKNREQAKREAAEAAGKPAPEGESAKKSDGETKPRE